MKIQCILLTVLFISTITSSTESNLKKTKDTEKPEENSKPVKPIYHVDVSIGCTGALISRYWVISTASCYDELHEEFHILAGYEGDKDRTDRTDDNGQASQVQNIAKYSRKDLKDIVLLKLKKAILEEKQTKFVKLPKKYHNFTGLIGDVTGREYTPYGYTINSKKCELLVDHDCEEENSICTLFPSEKSDACLSDLGAPMIIKGTNILMGVMKGERPRDNGLAPQFLDVRKYLSWIKKITGLNIHSE